MEFEHVTGLCAEKCWGRTISSSHIRFYGPSTGHLDPRLVAHELGHAFNGRVGMSGTGATPYDTLGATWSSDPMFPRRDSPDNGFAGPKYGWQQSGDLTQNEEFADMFVGWTYQHFAFSEGGQARSNWMNQADHMPYWTFLAISVN